MTDPLITRSYKKFEKNVNGQQLYAIKFTEGEFSDIMFSYGKVEFVPDEDNDKLVIKFDYTVHEGSVGTKDSEFKKELGDFLVELIAQGILDNDLVYTGGIKDE